MAKKTNGGDKPRRTRGKSAGITKNQVEHLLRLALMRDCVMYGKSYEASRLYFESKGLTLGTTNFAELRKELKSSANTKEWFSREALFVIEEDHQLSVERIRMMENRLLLEFEQVSSTNFYKYINSDEPEQGVIRNKSHDAQLMLRIIQQFQSLQETKTKMFSATPLVQEMMSVHAQQQEEKEQKMFQTPQTKKELIRK